MVVILLITHGLDLFVGEDQGGARIYSCLKSTHAAETPRTSRELVICVPERRNCFDVLVDGLDLLKDVRICSHLQPSHLPVKITDEEMSDTSIIFIYRCKSSWLFTFSPPGQSRNPSPKNLTLTRTHTNLVLHLWIFSWYTQ